jgi:regulator of PEP synthase PpsR (kinase-PPPase family)
MEDKEPVPPVYVVSGNLGALGEQLARTGLAQFEGVNIPLRIVQRVRQRHQLERIIDDAARENALIVHTMVNAEMRRALIEQARQKNVETIDALGPFLEYMTDRLQQKPVGQPGMYRQLHETYFKRIEANEFTVSQDDGVGHEKWQQAEIVLTGVSRVGKTPVSLYLSMLGWKVANVPLMPEMPPPQGLFKLDRRRVVGLTIDPTQLMLHRQHRQSQLGVIGKSSYTHVEKIYAELQAAQKIFRRGGFKVIDVTNKPIESCADQIVDIVSRRLKTE